MIPEPWHDKSIAGTPAWWIKTLTSDMDARDARLQLYDEYFVGKHRLAFATERYRQRFGTLFKPLSDNFSPLVVNAPVDRLHVRGFLIPKENGRGGARDPEAWAMWQRNRMDLYAMLAHKEAGISEEVYALAWWGEEKYGDADKAVFTIEHPRQFIARSDPKRPWRHQAALKRWVDDTGLVFLELYLPERIFKFQSDRKVYERQGRIGLARDAVWVPREENEETWPLNNPLGEVPVVRYANDERLLTTGSSEIAEIIPIQDSLNKILADMLIASEYQSFKQRAIIGLEIPTDPITGEVLNEFYKQLIDNLWLIQAEQRADGAVGTASVWESGQVDLTSHISAAAMLVQHMASRTETPVHYFIQPNGQYPSGESLKTAETPLVSKTKRKMVPHGESHEGLIRLGFKIENNARADAYDSETIWANPETRSEAVTADAALKLKQIGAPDEAVWDYWGASPEEVEDWAKQRDERVGEVGPPTPPEPAPATVGVEDAPAA